jgi:signal transduction histidine kinase
VPAGHDGLLQATLVHLGGGLRTDAPGAEGGVGREAQLRHIARTLSEVYHDLNNPLAIIAGNAQFYGELAGAMGVSEELSAPVADIEAASEKMSPIIERLQSLKREVLASLEPESGSEAASG